MAAIRHLVPLLVAACLAACQATPAPIAAATPDPAAASQPSPVASPPASPTTLANAAFVDLQGGKHDLQAFRGKYVLLTLFAYWCPHCQVMLPRLQTFMDQNQRADFVWVPLEASAGTQADVEGFVKTYGITSTVYLDPSNQAGTDLGVASFPTDYLLGPDGTVLAQSRGEISDADLKATFTPPGKP